MRLLAVGFALASFAATRAAAVERPVTVLVPSFAAPDALAIFAPEVARAVAGGLQQAGVDIAFAAPASGSPAVTVAGRIDSLDGERVRLTASIGAHTVQAEGPLEQVDGLAADLAHRLVPLVPAGARHAPSHLSHADLHQKKGLPGAAPVTTPAPVAATGLGVPSTSPPAVAPPIAAAPAPTVAAPLPTAAAPPVTEPAPPVAAAAPPATVAKPAADPTPAPSNIQDPGSSTTLPAPADRPAAAPDKPAKPADPGYEALSPPRRRTDPHRVVLHTVRMPDGCATGAAATYALREAIERRGGFRVVAGGCGIVPPGSAVAEGMRAGAASVVMSSFDWIRYEPLLSGVRPYGRVRIVVVRDGRASLVQTVDVSSRAVALPADVNRVAYDLATAAALQLGSSIESALTPNGEDGADPAPR